MVYLAWTGVDTDPGPGPWSAVHVAARGLLLIDSTDTLSRVFHELKWSLPDDTPLIVTPVTELPKLRGLTAGSQSWLRARLA